MSVVFNKQLLFENIGFLVRERGLKIGELETAAGVSPGYISRTSKDGGPTPGIEFVVRVASELKVSIDTLISTNLADITPTERYLIGFLDKLVSKTGDHQMIWCSVTEKKWREEADNGNPLFRVRKRPTDGSSSNYPFVLLLNSLEEPGEYMPYGPCYYLNLSPNDILWITRPILENDDVSGTLSDNIELYMQSSDNMELVCRSVYYMSSPLDKPICELYAAAQKSSKHPVIGNTVKTVIDRFMEE